MTEYQRGNRDGLLSLAAWAEGIADQFGQEVAYLANSRRVSCGFGAAVSSASQEQIALNKMVIYQRIAEKARKMAEALPLDPTGDTP